MFSEQDTMADYEALLSVDAPKPQPRRRLHRMDVVLVAVLLLAACYVGVRPPALRTANPLLLPPKPTESQYLTYDALDETKRQSGYSVSYSSRGFEVDGKQTLLLGGSIHYARSSEGQWEQLLREAKRDGLNHIEMYVFWNLHEPQRGVFNFVGNANVTRFYELAAEVGMFLHVRFGPYVCAEWSNGGLPVWLNWMPGMKVRSSNAPWQREMERFVRYMVDLSRPFLAKNGGPIIMAQIENEFAWHDPEYIEWCGDLVKSLETEIPWVMCYANAAENTILSCNANDCVDFAVKHVKERPSDPLVWTEDEGWFQTWQKDKKNPLPNDQRTPEDMAYAVARWFAVGGAAHNYYMYHGGNNYGRAASAGVTTMYADGVNLHSDGLSNEPKRSHLRKLHEALIECNDVLLHNERQVLNPHDLPHADGGMREASSQQRGFIYGPDDGQNQVAFLENMAGTSVPVMFSGRKYELAPYSMLILKDGAVLFDTADVQKSFSGHQHRAYAPVVHAASLEWATWNELNVSSQTPRKRVVSDRPVEQLRLTADRTDYLTYETTFTLKGVDVDADADLSTLKVTSCDATSIVAFVDGWLIGKRVLAYPGGNCSKEFKFHLPANIDVDRQHHLKLVSVSLGIFSLGSNHSKGITGRVRIGGLDLTAQRWEMHPGLVGEQLEIYRSQWVDSVPWTPVVAVSALPDDSAQSGRQLMSWYRTSFRYSPQMTTSRKQESSTLLDCMGLTRGRAYINGYDLGRYWLINDEGEFVQRYYHVPKDWLSTDHENLLVVFDELGGSVANVQLVSSTMVHDDAAAALETTDESRVAVVGRE